jgi:8-oxo-dGTP diphosphatase
MAKVVLTCKVMVHDKQRNRVVLLDRVRSWKGITFPGGHIENGESIVEGAIREIREETGLTVWGLKHCGYMHWFDEQAGDRYIVFNFKTENFEGELLNQTDEGTVFWGDVDSLPSMHFASGFKEELPMFFEGPSIEGFTVTRGELDDPVKWF